MELDQIREDLKEIRYYYSRKTFFDQASNEIGANTIVTKVHMYNNFMKTAKPLLYDLYVCLYTKNYTQENLANELGYTPEYIQMLNKKMLLFLQNKFENKGE